MKKTVTRFVSALMSLCLLATGVPALAEEETEDENKEEGMIIEDVLLTDDGEEVDDDLAGFVIDDGTSDETEMDLGEEDTSIDPSTLELNENLPSNVINILLVGIDTRSTDIDNGMQHNDVNMVMSVNTETGDLKLTSILRDCYVEVPGLRNKTRINNAYAKGGGELAMRTVNHNFELNIQYYVSINFYGLASIIDAIGGVDVELTKIEAGAINTYLKKHPPAYDNKEKGTRVALERKAGVQHLDGVQAVMYARLREIDNDFARTARQRNLMEILLKTVLENISLDTMMNLIDTCMDYVNTNLNGSALLSLAMGVLQSGIVEKAANGETLIEQHRIPMDKTYSYKDVNGASVVYMGTTNLAKNVQALHEFIYGEYIPAE